MAVMNLAGVDEAGRGPVLGPLVVAGVVLPKKALEELVALGLADSKCLTRAKREILYDEIIRKAVDHKIVILPAATIDSKRHTINLNKIELEAVIEILGSLNHWTQAFIDAFDKNNERLQLILRQNFEKEIIAEHFADVNYPVVSAASVIAKVTRDREIDKLHELFGVDFGSGYPSDPKTNKFLEDYYSSHKDLPSIARKSWGTAKKIINDYEQKQLEDFIKE